MSDNENNESEKDDKNNNDSNDKKTEPGNSGDNTDKPRKKKKFIGTLKDNIKGALKGNIKDKIILKAKLIIYPIIITLLLICIFVFELTGSAQSSLVTSMGSILDNSTTEAAEHYKEKGSLILASDEELSKVSKEFMDEMEKKNKSYYETFKIQYEGIVNNTVASKVKHITTNFDENKIEEIPIIEDKILNLPGAASLTEKRSIIDHILRAEKYNFNNIIWRSYTKGANDNLVKTPMTFQLDKSSGLKYPSNDANDVENEAHNINFFVNKVGPYLQTWHIPFDLAAGTQDSETSDLGGFNTKFAYQILASAYHEIVIDRYKIETLNRTTNYRVYDEKATRTTITRTCNDYEVTAGTNILKKKGDKCTQADYKAGLCIDAVTKKTTTEEVRCTITSKVKDCKDNKPVRYDEKDATVYYVEVKKQVACSDIDYTKGTCSYGILKDDITETTKNTVTYCMDKIDVKETEEKDKRESVDVTENTTYRWDYVISSAKMFDKVVNNKYNFKAYYKYPQTSYYNFINKKTDDDKTKTVENFKTSEEENSKSASFTHTEEDYYENSTVTIVDSNWNSDRVVTSIPNGAKIIAGTIKVNKVKETISSIKDGKKYTDTYNWNDELSFDINISGIYNVESVKDVTGDDLSNSDIKYYTGYYNNKEINLIDLMNSDDKLFNNYLSNSYNNEEKSKNIGYKRSYLDVGYETLKKGLTDLIKDFPSRGLAYGESIGIKTLISGISWINLIGITDVNAAIANYAESFLGNNYDEMASIAKGTSHYACFNFKNHWCAMFASFCLKMAEDATGVKTNIPIFKGCTSFREKYLDKPGFYDIEEFNLPAVKTTDPKNLCSINAIQPGDLVFFYWGNSSWKGREHVAVVYAVERNENGEITAITTIDGNWGGGSSDDSYNYSSVKRNTYTASGRSVYNNLTCFASFISISTVVAEAEIGNVW